jgi:hypothetical protein
MNRKLRAALASTAALLAVSAAAGPASAAEMQPMDKHTGTSGCFNWSWADGWDSTTVYYHNTCTTTHVIEITWNHDVAYDASIPAGVKGHANGWGSMKYVWDRGACGSFC